MCCCCKSELSEFETDTQNNNGVTYAPQQEDIYKTRAHAMYGHQYNRQEQIFQTRPPCWFGHECNCPCHRGGICLVKLKSK